MDCNVCILKFLRQLYFDTKFQKKMNTYFNDIKNFFILIGKKTVEKWYIPRITEFN